MDKFKYLISYLEGKAREAIAGIAITSANYCRALNRLQERFGDIQPIIDDHMQALLHLPIINSIQDLRGLRKLVDRVLKNVDALEALGKTETYYAGAVTSVIMESIPQEIALSLRKELGADIKDASRLISALSRDVMEREKTSRKLKSRIRSPSPTHYQPTTAAFLPTARTCASSVGRTILLKPAQRSPLLLQEPAS